MSVHEDCNCHDCRINNLETYVRGNSPKVTFTVEGKLNQRGTVCRADVDNDTIKEYVRSGTPIQVIVRNSVPRVGTYTMSLCNVTAVTRNGSDGEYTHLVISGTADVYGITRYIRIAIIDSQSVVKIYSSNRENTFSTSATNGMLLLMDYPERLSSGDRIILNCSQGWSDEETKYIGCKGVRYNIAYSDVKFNKPFTIELEVIDTVCYIKNVLEGTIPRKEITADVVSFAGSATASSNNMTEVKIGTANIRREWDGNMSVYIEIPSYQSTTTYNLYKNVIMVKEDIKLKHGIIMANLIVYPDKPLLTYYEPVPCYFFPGSMSLGSTLIVKNVASGARLSIHME